MTNGSLMKVESIAEGSLGAFCNTFDLHYAIIGLENQFLFFFLSGCSRQYFSVLALDCTCPSTSKFKFFTCPVPYDIGPDGTSKAVSKVHKSVSVYSQDSA